MRANNGSINNKNSEKHYLSYNKITNGLTSANLALVISNLSVEPMLITNQVCILNLFYPIKMKKGNV